MNLVHDGIPLNPHHVRAIEEDEVVPDEESVDSSSEESVDVDCDRRYPQVHGHLHDEGARSMDPTGMDATVSELSSSRTRESSLSVESADQVSGPLRLSPVTSVPSLMHCSRTSSTTGPSTGTPTTRRANAASVSSYPSTPRDMSARRLNITSPCPA